MSPLYAVGGPVCAVRSVTL